jgi:hypothetical protein
MEKNLFENVEIVNVYDPTINQDELVYISDEEEIRTEITTTLQIALQEDLKNSPQHDHSEEDENNHPMHVKLEKIESDTESEFEGDGDTIVDSDNSVELEISNLPSPINENTAENGVIKYEPPDHEIPESVPESFEAQFELVERKQDIHTEIASSLDHSYSQLNASKTTFCDDIVQNLLDETNTKNDPKAIDLLTTFTKFMENFISGEDQTSEISLYLKQMKIALQDKAAEFYETKRNEIKRSDSDFSLSQNVFEEKLPADVSMPESDENNDRRTPDISLNNDDDNDAASQKSEILFSNENVKEEPTIEDPADYESNKNDNQKDESMTVENSLEKYISSALIVGEEFFTFVKDLSEHVFVNNDDIENGKQKLGKSIFRLMEKSYNLLSDIGGEGSVDDKFSIFKREPVQNRDIKGELKESSKDSESENDARDDEIDKLLDFNSLLKTRGEVSQKEKETKDDKEDKSDNQIAKTKLHKSKKDKKHKKNDEDDLDLSSSDESIISNFSESDKDEKEKLTESDEEAKMIQRNEENVRRNLLGDSESDSDDSESENSSFLSFKLSSSDDDDNIKAEKNKRLKKRKLKSSEKDSDSETERKIDKAEPVKIEKTDNDNNKEAEEEEEEEEEEKVKKRRKLTGFEAEIFSKNFLELDSGERAKNSTTTTTTTIKSEKSKQERKCSSSSQMVTENENVVDLSVYEKRSEKKSIELDLPKYFEKRENLQLTASNSQNEQSDRKPPSPSIDEDISSESDSEVSSTNAEGQPRRRKQLTEEELKEETKKAKNEEKERLSKLSKKTETLSQYLTQRNSQSASQDDDVIPPNELILDYSEKKNLEITVHPKLVDRLKQHQIDGVKFMYDK